MKYLLIFLTMLVPASMFLVPQVQAQEDPSVVLSTSLSGAKDLPLKAIGQSDGEIDIQNDFEFILVSVEKGADFHVLPSQGSLETVRVTDERRLTTELDFSPSDGRVTQDLQSKAYLLDVIVDMQNGDEYLYQTVLAVLEPGQTLSQVNTQNIIQKFVSVQNDNDDEPPEQDREEICRFTPSHPICAPNEDGECGEGFAMNEDGQCFPRGDCPDGYHRANDDETGACISEDDLEQCNDGSWKHPGDTCYGEDPTPTPPIVEEPLDSNCGGVPCTASEKEDSWLSDTPESAPGVPIEGQEEQSQDEQSEEQQPEQEESNAENSEQEN